MNAVHPAGSPPRTRASATPARPPAPPADTGRLGDEGPEWLGTTALPEPLVIDGKVEEWESLGSAQQGWVALLPDRVVIAGWAPAGAPAIEVSLGLGERHVGGRARLLQKGEVPVFECWAFSGSEAETCKSALAAQTEAMEALWKTTWRTYEIQGTRVTIDERPAVSTRGALWSGPLFSRFELAIPLEEVPALMRPRVKHADIQVRAAGVSARSLPVAEVFWAERVPVGGEKAILADAVLTAVENHGDILAAVLDPSGKEPVLRAWRLAPVTGKTPDQRPLAVIEAPSATKVEAQAGELELLRFDALGVPGLATRKAGRILDAFSIHGYEGGTFRRFVVREDDIDIGYEDYSLGGMADTEQRFIGVARASVSGTIDPSFAGSELVMAPGSRRTFARDLSRFDLNARVFLGTTPDGFIRTTITWRYNPKTRTYKMDGE